MLNTTRRLLGVGGKEVAAKVLHEFGSVSQLRSFKKLIERDIETDGRGSALENDVPTRATFNGPTGGYYIADGMHIDLDIEGFEVSSQGWIVWSPRIDAYQRGNVIAGSVGQVINEAVTRCIH